MSSAIASQRIGRVPSVVRPCPCRSTAITCRAFASTGSTGANMSVDIRPPCSISSGSPLPRTS